MDVLDDILDTLALEGVLYFRTGYQSPAAFSRAFSGRFGLSPSQYRRRSA